MRALTPDELLTTTRTVRKRLDLARPVPRALVEECLDVALQAPNGGNLNAWRWIAVDDRATIRELARLYNQASTTTSRRSASAVIPAPACPARTGSAPPRST